MKKQVTFAESRMIHRLYQDDTLPRSAELNETKGALTDTCINFKQPAVRCEHEPTIQIPQTITAAPFLKHAALTPAQKEYLYTIAASYSTTHVRNLITQHYMNVLHRCIPTGYKPERDRFDGTSATLPTPDEAVKHRLEVPARPKQDKKINAGARNHGKSFLPKIPNRRTRLSNTSASKQRKMKKHTTTSPTLKRTSPRRARITLLEDEDEDEEGLHDSLSDCLSSLSLGEWDDDTFSDL
ncbi:hypothetical protein GBF38_021299 [Nibea albiflora]|uniref:Uncharacterized protein n=1 Tax=Nibea albiflora TaxID=240163 RepID=A0ACB7FGW3_NIBAL|nr:hypothetical protein GBF38_021299 [Nibea albiflora]